MVGKSYFSAAFAPYSVSSEAALSLVGQVPRIGAWGIAVYGGPPGENRARGRYRILAQTGRPVARGDLRVMRGAHRYFEPRKYATRGSYWDIPFVKVEAASRRFPGPAASWLGPWNVSIIAGCGIFTA